MKEDDENPYVKTIDSGVSDETGGVLDNPLHLAWNQGRQYEKDNPSSKTMMTIEGRAQSVGFQEGQLHPSPQTIKRIQNEAVDNFAEKVNEAIDKVFRDNRLLWITDVGVKDIIDTLKEKEGED